MAQGITWIMSLKRLPISGRKKPVEFASIPLWPNLNLIPARGVINDPTFTRDGLIDGASTNVCSSAIHWQDWPSEVVQYSAVSIKVNKTNSIVAIFRMENYAWILCQFVFNCDTKSIHLSNSVINAMYMYIYLEIVGILNSTVEFIMKFIMNFTHSRFC